MDYIVSPWLVYLMAVCQSVCVADTIIFVLSCIGLVGVGLMWLNDTMEYNDREKRNNRTIKGMWIFVPIALFSLIIGIFLPDKQTIIQMLVAKNLTYTNAGKIVTEGKNIKDELKKDVIDIILAVKQETK